MNQESIKNKKIIALVLAIVLVAGSLAMESFRGKDIVEENKFLKKELGSLFGRGYGGLNEILIEGGDSKNRILILEVNGGIQDSEIGFLSEGYDHNFTMEVLESVKDDPTIKGLILSIDSPGGTVYHSAQLWNQITKLKKDTNIPIYASMGSMAASGGYYIAAPADKIFASKETTTGSIGVIADYINYSGLEEKLGVKHNIMKSGPHKDIGSASRKMTDEDASILQSMVDESYEEFVKVVADGRNMDREEVKAIADGRIYSGQQAKNLGLVDDIGYLEDAMLAMAREIGVENPEFFQMSLSGSDYISTILKLGARSSNMNNELGVIKDLKEIYGANNRTRLLYLYGGF